MEESWPRGRRFASGRDEPQQEVLFILGEFGIVLQGRLHQLARLGRPAAVVVRAARAQVLADDGQLDGARGQVAARVALVDLGKEKGSFLVVLVKELDA